MTSYLTIRKAFLFLSIFLCNHLFLSAQIDQEGQVLSGVDVTCQNDDPDDLWVEIEEILGDYTFTDNNTGECNGNIAYSSGTHTLITPLPLCDGQIEVEMDYDCDGTTTGPITVFIDIAPPTGPLEWLIDPEDYFPPDITYAMTDALCTNEYDPCMWLDENMMMYPWER